MFIVSCSGDPADTSTKTKQTPDSSIQVQQEISRSLQDRQKVQNRNTAIEVMAEKDILFNGKLKRYFTLNEFTSVLGKPDSSKLLSDIEPCTNIFQEADGSVDPEAKYLYKNGSRFEGSQRKVAIDEIRFGKGDFLVFKNHTLNKNTTMADLRRIFPNAAKHIGIMDVAGEGKLQVLQLREDDDNVSDGHINLFIKNGKLYFMHWWFPC
ncbi:hypothetical protein [Mucilaginibacter auburnensis]|uniref:hypothetical protein n=1 Tax=Mucilaginibacter auburnensis TaxID=1457233 RepID=UPI0012FDAD42|nr:hypothetical protein [Mucilaginibacter auburnensis]